jgi:predicted DNA binding CopG/RHH family protein
MEADNMRKEYDFSKAKSNPYLKKMRKQISIRIDMDTIDYFKRKAQETGIAYQNLINLYLSDCALHSRNINIVWK